jgi:hypothetical protein
MALRRRRPYSRGPGRRLAFLRDTASQENGATEADALGRQHESGAGSARATEEEVSAVYIGGGLLLLIVVIILLIWIF